MNVEQIKDKSIIKLSLSAFFYQRLQMLAVQFTELQTPEELKIAYDNIRADKELTTEEYNLETLLILINSIEIAVVEQDLLETVAVAEVADVIDNNP